MVQDLHAHLVWFSSQYKFTQEAHLRAGHQTRVNPNDTAPMREEKHAAMHESLADALHGGVESTDHRAWRACSRRLRRAIRLLTWVDQEVDLSGEMELAAAIRAFLSHE